MISVYPEFHLSCQPMGSFFTTTNPLVQNTLIPCTLPGRGRDVLKPGCLPLLSTLTTSEQCQLWASISVFLCVVIVLLLRELMKNTLKGSEYSKQVRTTCHHCHQHQWPSTQSSSSLLPSPTPLLHLPPDPLRKTLTSLLMKTGSC